MKSWIKRIKGILLALVYVAIYDALSFVTQMGFLLWKKVSGEITYEQAMESIIDGSYALTVISMIISLWIFMLIGKLRKKPLGTVIGEEKYPIMVYAMAGFLAIGTRMLVAVYHYFAQDIAPLRESIEKAAEFSPNLSTPVAALIALFAVSIIAPVFEEVLFRGIVQSELMKIMRPWAAIFMQGIIFGVAHGVLFQSIFATVVGIVLGVIYYKTNDIKIAMICHGVFNYAVVLTGIVTSLATAAVFFAFGLMIVVFAMTYIIRNRK